MFFGANYYVLSGNKLYDTEGATGAKAVNLGANKAYIDVTKITTSAPGMIFLEFAETTGIDDVVKGEEISGKNFFDLQGRRVAQPTKGLYIVNGKKVVIK